MTKILHKGKRKAVTAVAHKARAGRSASVMKPEYLAEIERFRLMDDTFMSKCFENAPECIELILRIVLGKKDLKVVKSQTEVLGGGKEVYRIDRDSSEMYFDVLRKRVGDFKQSEEGRRTMCKAMERIAERRKRETMIETAKRLLANGKLLLKEIAECTGLSLAQVKKLQASM